MSSIKQNKVKINATVSGWVDKKAKTHLEDRDEKGNLLFGNYSNFVESAMIYFLSALDTEKNIKQQSTEDKVKRMHDEDKHMASLVLKLLTNHPELINEIVDHQANGCTTLFNDDIPRKLRLD